ncbi:hypothetical protein GUJ93_ZPchr0010g7989 [Zizania palustris]|uniref:HP domain-containing protein n=1 Tax=Zizania palustris TaxID=103762 RepID=A0A8J6BLK4_ZIZPA|nr:hypothetical protein GUJ93_ZPchr0010g7989 [Zizania palustris]
MPVSMKDLDPAFHGARQKEGLEIWRIENFKPVPIPTYLYGKFFMGDSYIILKTTALKNGSLRHDIHYWIGKDTSQDEAGTAAVLTVELDAALGGRAVQYREVQGNETEKFLSYFRPCIMPQPGGVASGFKHVEVNEQEHVTHLYVTYARSSLNHDDIFILDTKSKIFQFNGSNSSIQERAKALEVVQYIKDTFHEGKCEVAAVEDGRLMADAEAGDFWGFFGGFAPLPRRAPVEDNENYEDTAFKLLCFNQGKLEPIDYESLVHELLETNMCFLLDCGAELFVWMGRTTSLQERKSASEAAEKLLSDNNRRKTHVIKVIEGFETVMFKSKFKEWPQTPDLKLSSEDGRGKVAGYYTKGKVAALLKRQGLNVKGLMKAAPAKEEPQAYIDCTGSLQVWRINDKDKMLLLSSDQSKFYSGDCYIFQYMYPGDDKDCCLIGTWFGKKSIEEDRVIAVSLASKMVESSKFQAVQTRLYEGKEPIQFFVIFQSFQVFKGGLSSGYRKFIAENGIDDDTYLEDGLALFRIQGSGPENMQAIQVDATTSSLNSSYSYILHDGNTVFTWTGNLTTTLDQELIERQLDVIKPNLQSRSQKEGSETDQFWSLLGGKSEYTSQKIGRENESDPHLFSCILPKGNLKIREIYHFAQDDLMTEDVYILDCHSDIFVWVGQQVDVKVRLQALDIGEKFLMLDCLMENLSSDTPIFIIMEGSEPTFFTRFFTWDSAKSLMHGNSYQRKLSIVKGGGSHTLDKPKQQTPAYSGRSIVQDKSQRSRSMSFSPEHVRVRGRSPAFTALAANFESASTRNLSTPPPVVKKLYPKSFTPDSSNAPSKSSATAVLTGLSDRPNYTTPKSVKDGSKLEKPTQEEDVKHGIDTMTSGVESFTINEDAKENEPEDDEGLPVYPYDRLKTTAAHPVTEIDVTRRETYLSSAEFKDKFGMTKEAFSKLPKWKKNRMKIALQLF